MAKILVIDDEAPLRRTIARILRRGGHIVHEAENGKRGIELFHQLQPTLVICDIVMPDVEGIETIRQMRREAPAMPILAISGRSHQLLYLRAAAEFGATASLEKPFDHKQLVATVADLLGDTSERAI